MDKLDFPLIEISKDRICYYRDLYRRYKVPLEIDFTRKIHAFERMGSYLFNRLVKEIDMKSVQWILFPKSGLGLDGQYATPELFLKNKYQLSCHVLDINDCGSLGVFRAMSLMLELSKNDEIKDILIVSINYKETGDYVGALLLSKIAGSIQVLYCDIISGNEKIAILMMKFNISDYQCNFIFSEFNDIDEVILNLPKIKSIYGPYYFFIVSEDKIMGFTGLLLLKIK